MSDDLIVHGERWRRDPAHPRLWSYVLRDDDGEDVLVDVEPGEMPLLDEIEELRRWKAEMMDAALDEIERLRAENEALRAALAVKDNHDHFDCTSQRELVRLENQRLRALIDAYAVAWHKGGWAGDTPVLMAASDALVAAATKEDDLD